MCHEFQIEMLALREGTFEGEPEEEEREPIAKPAD